MGSKHRRRTRSRLKQYHFIPRYPLAAPALSARIACLAATGTASTFRIASHRGGLRPVAIRSSGSRLYRNPYDGAGGAARRHGQQSQPYTPPSPSSLTWRSEFPSTVLRVFVATGNRRISRYAARQMLFPK